MSRKYKFYQPDGLYFVNFAAVYWMDLFVREEYCAIVTDALNFLQAAQRDGDIWLVHHAVLCSPDISG